MFSVWLPKSEHGVDRIGDFGGALGGGAVPWLMEATGKDWDTIFYVAASPYLISAVCWFFINSDDRLEPA